MFLKLLTCTYNGKAIPTPSVLLRSLKIKFEWFFFGTFRPHANTGLTRQLGSQKELRWDKMALRSFKTCLGSVLENYVNFGVIFCAFWKDLSFLLGPILEEKKLF